LKAYAEEVYIAIKLLNDVGSDIGDNGMPEFLPGLNFVFGLEGETKDTYRLNYDFLKKILDDGLLLRRINLRQIIPIPGTRMFKIGNKIILKNKNVFKRFKKEVSKNIENVLLKRMLPEGSILKDVFLEKYKGKLTFGRQIGSYPLLVGIPGIHRLYINIDVKVTDHGFRSITAVPFPLDINNAQRETIEALPGIGKKRAINILANRPYKSKVHFINSLDDSKVANNLFNYISIK
jgi:radical SAM superfamily enzyme with C-terminal helix-hairpin-helix motif